MSRNRRSLQPTCVDEIDEDAFNSHGTAITRSEDSTALTRTIAPSDLDILATSSTDQLQRQRDSLGQRSSPASQDTFARTPSNGSQTSAPFRPQPSSVPPRMQNHQSRTGVGPNLTTAHNTEHGAALAELLNRCGTDRQRPRAVNSIDCSQSSLSWGNTKASTCSPASVQTAPLSMLERLKVNRPTGRSSNDPIDLTFNGSSCSLGSPHINAATLGTSKVASRSSGTVSKAEFDDLKRQLSDVSQTSRECQKARDILVTSVAGLLEREKSTAALTNTFQKTLLGTLRSLSQRLARLEGCESEDLGVPPGKRQRFAE